MGNNGKQKNKIRVLLTGGGSGGHVYPLIAVAIEIQMLAAKSGEGIDVRYVGTSGVYRTLFENNAIIVHNILGAKLRRYFSLANFIDIPKLIISFVQALWYLFFFMPDVVFSKGGPGALSVVFAARWYRIPVVIHESDTVPGLTNKISGKFANTIALSFVSAQSYFDEKKIVVVGNPVRTVLFKQEENDTKEHIKKFWGFDAHVPLILVLGGSQGATRINSFIIDVLRDLLPFTQVLHQTGKANYQTVLSEISFLHDSLDTHLQDRYKAVDYFNTDIRLALISADIVVSRAGAGSIFELAAFSKPSILLPLPESAGDHQVKNAYEYAETGAALVVEESNLLPNMFINQVKRILESSETMNAMGKAAYQFYRPDAALNLAKIVLQLGE
ncbi:MAG: UDP-N-acetylglucosamine--N-acetylmuramyl-(pentapeptide) pyrophosphoryl-undecaprenol N-acetylglucosamine transferase [bacterium]